MEDYKNELIENCLFYDEDNDIIINPDIALKLHQCDYTIEYDGIISLKKTEDQDNNYMYYISKLFEKRYDNYISFMYTLHNNKLMNEGDSISFLLEDKHRSNFSSFYIENPKTFKKVSRKIKPGGINTKEQTRTSNKRKYSKRNENHKGLSFKGNLKRNGLIYDKVSDGHVNISLYENKNGGLGIRKNDNFNPESTNRYLTFANVTFIISKNNYSNLDRIIKLVKKDGQSELAEKLKILKD